MNIFFILLMFLFMFSYYYIDNTSLYFQNKTTKEFYTITEKLECLNIYHESFIKNWNFNDKCTKKYNIESQYYCVENNNISTCSSDSVKFALTTIDPIDLKQYSDFIYVLSTKYKNVSNLGLFQNGYIVNGESSRKLPQGINLVNNTIIKFEQINKNTVTKINNSIKNICVGDTIYDKYQFKCIADKTKRRVCKINEYSVFVNNNWECVKILN